MGAYDCDCIENFLYELNRTRVDLINKTIMQQKKDEGYWIEVGVNKDTTHNICCSECGAKYKSKGHANSYYTLDKFKFCPSCGIKMERKTDE